MANSNDYVFQEFYAPHLYAGKNTLSSGQEEAMIERVLRRILTELAMNRFEWTGLPESVSERWLEMNCTTRGLAVFFCDEEITGKHLVLSGSGYGALNLQGDYTKYQVWGNGMAFFNTVMDAKDVVPIWSNYLRSSDLDIIAVYARRIAQMDRSIEINALNARRTKIIPVSENRKLTFDNINRQIEQGKAVVKVSDTIGQLVGQMEALDLGVDPSTIVNLDIARGRQWNTALTLLGINNANQDKKERLVAAEVSGNDDEIENIRAINLNSRKIAAEQINKRWPGLKVEVEFRTDMHTAELTDQASQQKVGGPNNEGDD